MSRAKLPIHNLNKKIVKMMRRLVVPALGALILLAAPCALEAQMRVSAAADVATNSRYVWRGITRRNDWVLQPDLAVGTTWPRSSLAIGGWANFEVSEADPEGTEVGLGQPFGEMNLWAQFEYLAGPFGIGVGYMRYFVDEGAAADVGTTVFNTTELYLDTRYRVGGLEPRATLWVDVDDVEGAYFEASVAYRLPVIPIAVPSLYLKMLYGFSWGQAVSEDDPEQGAYFGENGLTHIDFSAETQIYLPVPIGPLKRLYAVPALHFQVNKDDATQRVSRDPDDAGRGSFWWFGVALSWYK
ncbi:MAG: hypothetical protein JSU87_14010 [Gemmatimonadota bacterium]|nr:MAG: hypothetical protein JSU87_14010 [Gemmatimonadota bacterium]